MAVIQERQHDGTSGTIDTRRHQVYKTSTTQDQSKHRISTRHRLPFLTRKRHRRTIVHVLKRLDAMLTRQPGLPDQRLPQRVMTANQILIALMQPLKQVQARQPIELSTLPAIALLARQYQIRNPVNRLPIRAIPQLVREEMIHFNPVIRLQSIYVFIRVDADAYSICTPLFRHRGHTQNKNTNTAT